LQRGGRVVYHRAMNAMPKIKDWTPDGWQRRKALQQPTYNDREKLDRVVAELSRLPPVVVSWEVDELKRKLADAQQGRRFLLQGGDCAENFDDCDSDRIVARLKILLQMSLVLLHGLKKPVIRVGRMAGQYAKPRSADTETRDGVTLPSYRGDIVNRAGFTPAEREPDPELLLRGYERAALTLNFVRALIDGGFADLHHPEYWDLGFVQHAELKGAYERIAESISDSLDFFEAFAGMPIHEASRTRFYASHEGLHLHYEQAQTRYIPRTGLWYNLSTHYPWIGMRTAQVDGAHVEYFRGIANPVAVKVSGGMDDDWLQRLVDVLNPDDEPGRLTLIHRLGAKDIEAKLPRLIDAVRRTGKHVLWVCDPMHGNTESTAQGYKTRRFDNILSEVRSSFEVHAAENSVLGGVHIELTGEDVTECTGGARGLSDADLARAYRTTVDPRLNYEQALELAMLIAGLRTAR
jgi:3-deoxy-7-phosphoheptulonate synthase